MNTATAGILVARAIGTMMLLTALATTVTAAAMLYSIGPEGLVSAASSSMALMYVVPIGVEVATGLVAIFASRSVGRLLCRGLRDDAQPSDGANAE